MTYQCISIQQAQQLITAGDVTLLDIRDAHSYSLGHVENATHVNDTNVESITSQANNNIPLIIYCYHGNSSKNAADYFYTAGVKDAYSVDGGFEQWKTYFPNT